MEVSARILKKLTHKKFRREFSLCILEGEKIIADNADKIIWVFDQDELPKDILKEVKSLETYAGPIAVAKIPNSSQTGTPATPFLVLDNIHEPGNMGAILRSSKAFGFYTVYCVDCVDPYSPKVLRASSGMTLQLNIIECGYNELPKDATLFIADMRGGVSPEKSIPKSSNFGLVLGNEGRGVSPAICNLPHTVISIPMNPDCESLNVGVAGGILMYCLSRK
jgi:TrmH family RNA methyltransferase